MLRGVFDGSHVDRQGQALGQNPKLSHGGCSKNVKRLSSHFVGAKSMGFQAHILCLVMNSPLVCIIPL